MRRFICVFLVLLALGWIKAEAAEEMAVEQAFESVESCECEQGEENCPCFAQVTEEEEEKFRFTVKPIVIKKAVLVKKAAKAVKVAKVQTKKLAVITGRLKEVTIQLSSLHKELVKLVKVAKVTKVKVVAAKTQAKALQNVINVHGQRFIVSIRFPFVGC